MRNKTLDIMEKLERRMNHLARMEAGAFGLVKAIRYRDRMEKWLAKEIEDLCEKANVP
jgi:hypothetical protein